MLSGRNQVSGDNHHLIYTCMFFSYRCVGGDNSPHFGINLGVDITGTINEGDAVYATYLN